MIDKNIFILKTDTEIKDSLNLICKEINNLFIKIKESVDLQNADKYFDKLQDIILLFDYIIYKRNIEITEEIWQFYKDFDRVDDIRVREYMFENIKSGKYGLLTLNQT